MPTYVRVTAENVKLINWEYIMIFSAIVKNKLQSVKYGSIINYLNVDYFMTKFRKSVARVNFIIY